MSVSPTDEVFATDCENRRVHVLAANGTLLHTWQLPPNPVGSYPEIYGIAVAKEGELVVGDRSNHCLLVVRPDGEVLRTWGLEGAGQLSFPRDLAVTNDGEVVVTEDGNHRVQVFRLSDGAFLRRWGTKGSNPGQFLYPRGVHIDSNGEVACLIEKKTHKGPNFPQVFVCDCANDRIQVFSLAGVFLRQWGSRGHGPGQFKHPSSVVMRGAEVLVSDRYNYRVQVFRRDGTFVRQWNMHGSITGQVFYPGGLAVTHTGKVLVSDTTRIQVFE